jgi:hypothetical protein
LAWADENEGKGNKEGRTGGESGKKCIGTIVCKLDNDKQGNTTLKTHMKPQAHEPLSEIVETS